MVRIHSSKPMSQTDIVLSFFDDVPDTIVDGFQNRNYIKTNTGKTLLSVPVLIKI